MAGMRCVECGEVRWSVLSQGTAEQECPLCGGRMIEERRLPGRRGAEARFSTERRDAPAGAGAARGVTLG